MKHLLHIADRFEANTILCLFNTIQLSSLECRESLPSQRLLYGRNTLSDKYAVVGRLSCIYFMFYGSHTSGAKAELVNIGPHEILLIFFWALCLATSRPKYWSYYIGCAVVTSWPRRGQSFSLVAEVKFLASESGAAITLASCKPR